MNERLRRLLGRRILPPLPPAAWRWFRRIGRWGLWSLLMLLILAGIAWTVGNAVGTSKLNGTLAELERAGYAVDLQKLAPKPVPHEENAAPLYTAAFALLDFPEKPDEGFELALAEGFPSLKPEDKASLHKLLKRNADSFALLRRARSRERSCFERDYTAGMNVLLPDVGKSMRSAKLLSIRAQVEMDQGLANQALESVRDIFALAECYREEPILVCQLVRFVNAGVGRNAVDFAVTKETPSEELRAWLEVVPLPQRFDGAIALGLRGELAMDAQIVKAFPDNFLSMWYGIGYSGGEELSYWTRLFQPVYMMDGARLLQVLRRMVDACGQPYLAARAQHNAIGTENRGWLRPLSLLLLPTCYHLDREAIYKASLAVTRTGLDWELAYKTGGRYPEKLEVIDPCTGEPLVYDANKGLIYSPGPPGTPEAQREDGGLVWKLRHQ